MSPSTEEWGSLGTPRPHRRAGRNQEQPNQCCRSRGGGPDRSPSRWGGTWSGCLAAAGAARTRVRGRDEADQRQACRRRFIGDAQRLWQYVTPPLPMPGWRGCLDSPPPHPIPAPHLLPLQLQPSGRVGLEPVPVELGPPHSTMLNSGVLAALRGGGTPLAFPFHPLRQEHGEREDGEALPKPPSKHHAQPPPAPGIQAGGGWGGAKKPPP